MSTPLHSWKQSGRIYLWRYLANQRNFPGLHLTADDAGVASLAELFEVLSNAEAGATRTVAVSAPTARELKAPSNRSAATVSPAKLRVIATSQDDHWQLEELPDAAVLSVGRKRLTELTEATLGISKGRGDFSLGNAARGSIPLWFWWRCAAI